MAGITEARAQQIMNLFRRLFRPRRSVPYLAIGYFGQETERPTVVVSAYGTRGAMTVFVEPKTKVGEARARMYGSDLARLLDVPLYDERTL